MTRIVFLGTPDAAVPTLDVLADRFQVGLVVTQPDRPRGRSGTPQPPPIRVRAQELGISVVQPERRSEIASAISYAGDFDLGVVVAYGMILDPEVLALPEAGLLNVHFSLLPRWRGAAPVQRALMAGDSMTGVTIIKLDEGLDTGPVLTAQAVDIEPGENAGRLTDRLARLGARLVASVIPRYLAGDIDPVPQSDEGASYAHKVTSDDRSLDISGTPADFAAQVRGLAPDPGATLEIDGEPHKILDARQVDWAPEPGTWAVHDDVPVVSVGDGGVELLELQPPGKTPRPGADWVRGQRCSQGTVS
ncbi:MAG: methionyl-tRNA formyltransferase [Acidimicrobiia bacterium]